ncbi:RNA-directed DNA polymerase (Reverse transcriptase), Ribonuclease H [Gossypium australe]|uniref:RNA-directed DNA polymerase (Reverse transcriptase), Ribonuclease H n=1 Tax=Gossypium australe TaxID=47621 RepID=A0A5B6VL63_9ROSI|nr:RNA-directed DNA polymerase (Reverse transcriptase), Ribonuclease H [Gossypium australe]
MKNFHSPSMLIECLSKPLLGQHLSHWFIEWSELKLNETEWIQSQYDQLNLIEEKRLKAICHDQMYQK